MVKVHPQEALHGRPDEPQTSQDLQALEDPTAGSAALPEPLAPPEAVHLRRQASRKPIRWSKRTAAAKKRYSYAPQMKSHPTEARPAKAASLLPMPWQLRTACCKL